MIMIGGILIVTVALLAGTGQQPLQAQEAPHEWPAGREAAERAFYARGDTATPVKTALVSIAVNICLMLLLMPLYAHVGLAIAAASACQDRAIGGDGA